MKWTERIESEVRSYCRAFPTTFVRARGAHLFDADGRAYLDFFSGAGALNYGHNDPYLRERLIAYLSEEGVTHSLDLSTRAKERFLEQVETVLLAPRGLRYKVQFPGPTGTNAVEAALKLARKVTGRRRVLAFSHGFHGMTLGSLAVTANPSKRRGAGVPLRDAAAVPFCQPGDASVDTISILAERLDELGEGDNKPAAVIVETVQGEGGVHVASKDWIRSLAELCRKRHIPLIVDDIQVGCGRTGPFFSFEPAEIEPDIVCLSKSLSGYGTPLSLVLIRPELDVWSPGEHNGTFRGHNLAFVTAAAALERYWTTDALTRQVAASARVARRALEEIAAEHPDAIAEVRGRGLIQGLCFRAPGLATAASRAAFERGLVIETAGPQDEVLKLLPPLTTTAAELREGLDTIAASVRAAIAASPAAALAQETAGGRA